MNEEIAAPPPSARPGARLPQEPPPIGDVTGSSRGQLPAANVSGERPAATAACDAAEPPCLDVHLGRSVGLPQRRQRRHAGAQVHWETSPYFAGSLSALALSAIGAVMGLGPLVWLSGLALAALGVLCAAAGWAKSLRLLSPADTLEDLALAVFEALRATGSIAAGRGPQGLHVTSQGDGHYRCYLTTTSPAEAALFAAALAEVLSPPVNPRYLIPRYVTTAPRSLLHSLGELLRNAIPGRPGALVVYHAVPTCCGTNEQHARAFQRAWNHYVSPGRLLPYQHPRAWAALARQRGEHPFTISSQLRAQGRPLVLPPGNGAAPRSWPGDSAANRPGR